MTDVFDDIFVKGKVGIGINEPNEKLEVDGNVKATEFIGKGSEITDLNGEKITNGIIDDSRIPQTIARVSLFDPNIGHKHTGDADNGPKISHSNLGDILEIDPTLDDTSKNKHISNALAKGWQDHITTNEIGITSSDDKKDKHVSDALAKGWQDHINIKSGNPHGTTAKDVGALSVGGGTIDGSLQVFGEIDIKLMHHLTGSIDPENLNHSTLHLEGYVGSIKAKIGETSHTVLYFHVSKDLNKKYIRVDWDLGANDIYSGKITAKELNVTGSKKFLINHPLHPDTHDLVHATLEGPEIAVFYRGEAQLSNGEIVVLLPDYFEALTRKENRTVLLTPKFEEEMEISMLAASQVKDGKFTVKTIDSKNPSQKFYWEVKAIRADVEKLEVEREKIPVK